MNTKQNISLILCIPFVMHSCTKDVGQNPALIENKTPPCTFHEEFSGNYLVSVFTNYYSTSLSNPTVITSTCQSNFTTTITIDAKGYPDVLILSPYLIINGCGLGGTESLTKLQLMETSLPNCKKTAYYSLGPGGYGWVNLRNDSLRLYFSLGTNHSGYSASFNGKKIN